MRAAPGRARSRPRAAPSRRAEAIPGRRVRSRELLARCSLASGTHRLEHRTEKVGTGFAWKDARSEESIERKRWEPVLRGKMPDPKTSGTGRASGAAGRSEEPHEAPAPKGRARSSGQ